MAKLNQFSRKNGSIRFLIEKKNQIPTIQYTPRNKSVPQLSTENKQHTTLSSSQASARIYLASPAWLKILMENFACADGAPRTGAEEAAAGRARSHGREFAGRHQPAAAPRQG